VLDAVRKAAEAAGEAILAVRASACLEVRQKPDGPVTAADLAANSLLEARLRELDRSAGWLSEETVDAPGRLSAERVWVVDPLDGTQAFIQGSGDFGVSIALVVNRRPIAAVIHFPATGETLWAEAGQGAWMSTREGGGPRRLAVADAPRPRSLTVRWSDLRRPWMHALKASLGVRLRPVGSTVRKLAMVARGEADGYVSPTFSPCQWDICAGDLIVAEAGGRLTGLDGQECLYNGENPRPLRGLVVSSAAVHGALLERVRALPVA
jgi:myo-inositol-1(or 4)-monophosphatase